MISLGALTTGQMAVSALLHGRVNPAIEPKDRRLDNRNIVIWGNPYSGGGNPETKTQGRGGQVMERFRRELSQQEDWHVCRLDPEKPDFYFGPDGQKYLLMAHLSLHPTGNILILETVSDRTLRMQHLSDTLSLLRRIEHREVDEPVSTKVKKDCLIVVGGDGTIAEAKSATDASVGLSADVLFENTTASKDQASLRKTLPFLYPAKAGTAGDYPRACGSVSQGFLSAWRRSAKVGMTSLVTRIGSGEEAMTLDTSHTLGAGAGARIFEEGDRTKFGFLRGKKLNYVLPVPGLLLKSLLSRIPVVKGLSFRSIPKDPLAPFWVHYRLNGGEVVRIQASDILVSSLRYIGGNLYSPGTPADGATAYILPPNPMATLPMVGESVARGAWKRAFRDTGTSSLLGRKIFLLDLIGKQRQLTLRPGDLLECGIFEDEAGEHPMNIPLQANGQFYREDNRFSVRVTDPYPHLLVDRESPAAVRHHPHPEAGGIFVRGLLGFFAMDLINTIGPNAPLVPAAMMLLGTALSIKAPRAALVGLGLSPLLLPVLEGVHRLTDAAASGFSPLGMGVTHAIGSLGGAAVAFAASRFILRRLTDKMWFHRFMTGRSMSKRMARNIGLAATGVLSVFQHLT